jgi:hypothetical protein
MAVESPTASSATDQLVDETTSLHYRSDISCSHCVVGLYVCHIVSWRFRSSMMQGDQPTHLKASQSDDHKSVDVNAHDHLQNCVLTLAMCTQVNRTVTVRGTYKNAVEIQISARSHASVEKVDAILLTQRTRFFISFSDTRASITVPYQRVGLRTCRRAALTDTY